MEMYLIKEKLWKIVTGQPKTRPGAEATSAQLEAYDDWLESDDTARAAIGLHVDDDQYGLLRGKSTSKEFWDVLKEHHERNSFGNKITLARRACSSRMAEGDSMELHLKQFNETWQRLDDLGEESMPERWRIRLLMTSLPKSYDAMISALEMRKEDELTMQLVQSKMLEEYKRRNEGEEQKSESVLKATEAKDTTCFFCNKKGHMKKDCQRLKRWKQKKSGETTKSSETASVAKETASVADKELLFAVSTVSNGAWIVDSGATSHISGSKKSFVSIDDAYRSEIDLADGNKVSIIGRGACAIRCVNSNGDVTTATVTDVLYAPDIGGNLLSVSKLAKKGFALNFNYDTCELKRDNKQVAVLDEINNLYVLRQSDVVCAVGGAGDRKGCVHHWHRVFGHRDPKAIRQMFSDERVDGAILVECSCRDECEVCLKAKMTRLPFPDKSTNRSKSILDLVHTDVCGPMQTESSTGRRYILTLIDDFSRFTVVSLLRHKSEVEDRIKEYISLVHNKFGGKPKIFRSDRGGEYLSNQFRTFLRKEGIEQQLTTPHTPQQNGIAERKNRTLVEMVRCMLTDAQLPNMFWAEAVCAANYIQNRVLTRSTSETPFKLWYGRRPDARHMRVFGQKCFVHVPKETRRKLDNTATEMVLVGYDEQSKAYRCYDMNNKKLIISRDVRFIDKADRQETAVEVDVRGKKRNAVAVSGNNNGQQGGGTDAEADSDGDGDDTFDDCASNLDATLEAVDEPDAESTENVPDIENEQQVAELPRRSQRANRGIPPDRFGEYVYVAAEPRTLAQALSSNHKSKWVAAMDDEMKSLAKNGTWSLCELPAGRTAIGSKWVYTAKTDASGEICRYKARLVAQGFSQKFGIDHDQVFAPVVRQTTFRILLSMASVEGLCVRHLDAKTAFLNGRLKETIYMRQPPGYEDKSKPNFVF